MALNTKERKLIRSDIYNTFHDENTDSNDKKISFFMKHTYNKRVLDLGCVDHFELNYRSKYWLHKAIKLSAKYLVGLDYYEAGVTFLKKEGFTVLLGDAQSFEIKEKFDVVTAGDLIEHLPNLEGFFKSVHKVLSSGGILVISTPNPWCWKYFLYHLFYKRLSPVNSEHVAWFCLQTLDNLSSRFGFKLVQYEYCSRRLFERLIPLPSHIKHTTLNVVFKVHKKNI